MTMIRFKPHSFKTYIIESSEPATVKGKFVFEISFHTDNSLPYRNTDDKAFQRK